MPKMCNREECTFPVFGGGFCLYHQGYRTDKKPKKKKVQQPIAQFSKKRQAQMREYRKVRNEFMDKHPICQVDECNKESQDCHHKRGKIGDDLVNDEYFMAVCRPCHKRIEENPEWAYENGYALKRI